MSGAILIIGVVLICCCLSSISGGAGWYFFFRSNLTEFAEAFKYGWRVPQSLCNDLPVACQGNPITYRFKDIGRNKLLIMTDTDPTGYEQPFFKEEPNVIRFPLAAFRYVWANSQMNYVTNPGFTGVKAEVWYPMTRIE